MFVIGEAMWKQSESPEKQLAGEIWEHIAGERAKPRIVLKQVLGRFGGRNGNG